VLAGEGRILIVRHGKDRGPRALSDCMAPVLEYIERQRPELHRRLQLHQTGEAAPNLGGIGVVIFWLAGPLNNYPACYGDAVRIADKARACDLTVINPPEALCDLSKTRQSQVWQEAGIRCSPVETFETMQTLKAASDRLVFPLMLRADTQHRQAGTAVVGDRNALLGLSEAELCFPCAVSPFVDVREGYRSAAPNSAYARLFHKNRLWVANNVIRTKHVFFSSNPIVSSKTAAFRAAARSGVAEYAVLLSPLHRECLRHDVAFWRAGEQHRELMIRACNVLGLQYGAIDYSNLADGTPILWEVNPVFQVPRARQIMLPRLRHAAERAESYCEAIAVSLTGLLNARQMRRATHEDAVAG
jgi:hypothetical protein